MYMIVQVLNQCYDNTVKYVSAAAPSLLQMGMTLIIEARIAFRNFSLAGQHLATYINLSKML